MRAVVVVVGLAGCAYHPGSFYAPQASFAGRHATAGCLDLAIDRRVDMDPQTAVLAYSFGNRCARPAVVDLAHAAVVGRTMSGAEVTLAPYDPHHEIRVVELDGRSAAQEAIAYPAEDGLAQLCVDAGSVAHAPSQWLCFGAVR